MPNDARALPRWDMTSVYPGLQSPEFTQALRRVIADIDALTELFAAYHIERRDVAPPGDDIVRPFETVVERYNSVLAETWAVSGYITCHLNTNSRDALAHSLSCQLQQHAMLDFIPPRFSLLYARFAAWVGSFDVDALIERSDVARAHAFALRKAHRQARRAMTSVEEDLAAALSLSGSTAWWSLYNTLTSQRARPDRVTDRGDRVSRARAYEEDRASWEEIAVPLAAALNGIKGTVTTLAMRRGWASPLDAALFDHDIDRAVLDAMLVAVRAALPDFRRYLRAKARALGVPTLAWYDLDAPLGPASMAWEFDDAACLVGEQFVAFSPRMGALAARAFRERWIDAEPRDGKQGGGSCMLLRGGESRILLNYTPTFGGVCALAHELGHAYHNSVLADRTMLQRAIPMTLAETASAFCETLVRQERLRHGGDRAELAATLDEWLQAACWYVVDNTAAFLFEQGVFEERQRGELSVDELKTLMRQAQVDTYGDAVDPTTLNLYAWADSDPLYQTSVSFYNIPYTFGLLFGLGLYARYRADPEGFRAGYDDLLAATGSDDAATVAARFGIDIRTPDFWREGLAVIRADIDRFEDLLATV